MFFTRRCYCIKSLRPALAVLARPYRAADMFAQLPRAAPAVARLPWADLARPFRTQGKGPDCPASVAVRLFWLHTTACIIDFTAATR